MIIFIIPLVLIIAGYLIFKSCRGFFEKVGACILIIGIIALAGVVLITLTTICVEEILKMKGSI